MKEETKNTEKVAQEVVETKVQEQGQNADAPKRTMSKTLEAALKMQGCFTINDPALLI